MRRLLATAVGLAVGAAGAVLLLQQGGEEYPGCQSYTPVENRLVAHAGGGLPDRTYANDLEAMNLAVRNGFDLIELDFMERGDRLTVGHDGMDESRLTVAQLMTWLDERPNVTIITDVKTDNLSGLAMLKRAAGPRIDRFVPQIYHPGEYDAVRELGYAAPILTIYRLPSDAQWIDAANGLDLWAVTMPVERRELAAAIRHPVFLHTVNEPMDGFGLYTDCLIPRRS
jgi:glycerophosphoryl diester phosphodiesterase